MFTLPHNTIAYLYKEVIDMCFGMFRLQGGITQQLSQRMQKGSFFLFINKWLTEVLRRLPEYRSSQYAYFDLLPGMLPCHSQKSDKAEVKL